MARTNHMENSSILSPSIRILRQPDSLGYQDFLPFDVVRKCAHWKMNLLANSKLYPHWVFLACDESIHVFHLNPIKHRCSPSIQVLQLPSPPEELLEIDRPTINYIRIFYLASIEILIAADSIFFCFFSLF
ncbi:hypothetical protein HMI55_007007 [Coelomomyces lativittatus]|nr:hypothetical protein HMI55_007007 [Coelomomyces lativittatus]